MSTELVVQRPSAVVPANEWLLISKQAEMLATSDIIPIAYRRKPANIVVAALTGRTHGWDVLTAMRNGHVIEGQWGMKPEAMLGLVRAAGHRVDIELLTEMSDPFQRGAVVTAHRSGEEPMVVRFVIADAIEIGLVGTKDGKLWARSSSGKRLPWEQYPVDMCMWRAVGKACRAKYSDITLGIYSAEELGAAIDAEGEVIDLGEVEHVPAGPQLLSSEAISKFVEACETEGLDPSEVMRRAFPDNEPDDPLTDADLPRLRDVFKAMVEAHAADMHAESTEPDPNFVDDEMGGGTGVPDDDAPEGDDEDRPASRAQVGKVKGEYERLGQPDRDKQLTFTSDFLGRTIRSHNELSRTEAHRLIERLVGLDP